MPRTLARAKIAAASISTTSTPLWRWRRIAPNRLAERRVDRPGTPAGWPQAGGIRASAQLLAQLGVGRDHVACGQVVVEGAILTLRASDDDSTARREVRPKAAGRSHHDHFADPSRDRQLELQHRPGGADRQP